MTAFIGFIFAIFMHKIKKPESREDLQVIACRTSPDPGFLSSNDVLPSGSVSYRNDSNDYRGRPSFISVNILSFEITTSFLHFFPPPIVPVHIT